MYDFTSVLMYRNKSNPDWNDLLIFNISTLDSPISLYVYDADIKQDTTLGIGTVDLRENSYILDGEDHDIVVEIQKPQKKKKNKKGKKSPPSPTTVTLSSSSRSSSSSNSDDDSKKPSIDLDYDEDDDYETNDVIEKKTTVTLKVKCYFDASKYYKRVAKYSFESPEEKTQNFAYIAYYNTIFGKFDEGTNIRPERNWLLREFGARFCVSDAYACFLKLQALVGNIDEHFTYNFSRTVVANARTLVRVTTTPNSVEQAGFQAVFRCFVTRLIEDYVPGTFIWNAEGDYVKTLAPLLSITEEILVKYPQKGTTYEKILQDAFCNAIRACLKRANKKFDWSNYQNAFKYKDLLEGDYRHVCDLIFRAIDKALPAAAAAAAYAGAVKGIEEYLSNDLGSYIAVVSGHEETIVVEMQKQQINVLRTIKAVQQLREDVHKAAAPRDLSVHQFTGLTILWCKKSQALLLEWVNSAVKNDRHVPANTNTHSSVAPIDVNEFVTQVIGQLNEIVIDDPFVWTQASELLVSTVLEYIKSESENACNYLESPERDHTKKLEYVCVALSNIEKVQETLYDVIEEVEKFMESWKKAHTARRFAALSSSLSPVATTRSVVTLTASDMGSTLSSRGGGLSISAFATPVKRGITKFNNTSPLCTSEISTNRSNNDYNCDGCCDDYGGGDDDDNDKMRMEVTTATVNDAISFAIAKAKKRMTDPLTTLGSYAAQVVTPAVVAGISGAKTIEEALGEISAYYDEELSVLSDHITQRMLKRALEEYLNTLLRRVWDVSEPSYALTHTEEDSSSSGGNSMDFTKAATCDRCMQIVEGLVKYFHADGAGINKQIIAKNRLYRAISQIIDAYRLSTEELITIEKLLTAKPPAPLDDKRFEGINPVLVDYILRNRATTGDKWAIAYSREGAGSEESNVVRLQLGLPPSEFLISKWMCFNGRNPGSLYLMSKHLGFNFVSKEEDPIVVHLKDLKSLAKVSVMIFMSGIEVKSCDGDAFTFSKFVNGSAEDIVEEITSQAILVGNTVLKSK